MASARARQAMIFLPKVLAPVAVAIWFGFFCLTLHYDDTRPTVRKPDQGRVYALNNHGHVVYLTANEENNLHNLEFLAITLFVTAFLIDYSQRERAFVGEIREEIHHKLYGLTTIAGWHTLGRTIQREFASIGPSTKEALWHRPTRVDIRAEDSISDCRDRLARSVYLNPMQISGTFDGKKLHLFVVRGEFRNSFAPHFYGKLESRSAQTTLTGRFCMHAFVKIFLGVWFGGLTAIEGWMLTAYLSGFTVGQGLLEEPFVAISFPVALMLGGLLMVHWCKNLAKDDEMQIVQFLQRTMGAHTEQQL
jgi:hypothetical protein